MRLRRFLYDELPRLLSCVRSFVAYGIWVGTGIGEASLAFRFLAMAVTLDRGAKHELHFLA
jgi:hypothetical protein